MTTPACEHDVTRQDGPANLPCPLCGPSNGLHGAITAHFDKQRQEQHSARAAELRDFEADEGMERLAARLADERRANPHAVYPADFTSRIAAYVNKRDAAAYFKATGQLPTQIVATHRPDDAA